MPSLQDRRLVGHVRGAGGGARREAGGGAHSSRDQGAGHARRLGEAAAQGRRQGAVLLWYSRSACATSRCARTCARARRSSSSRGSTRRRTASGKEGFLFVFSSLEDLETNFDDLCDLTLKERVSSAGAKEGAPTATSASPAGQGSFRGAKGGMARNYSFDGAPAGNVALHVLVLGESEGAVSGPGSLMRSNSVKAMVRQSFRYAILDEAQTARMYHRVLASKGTSLRSNGVETVSVHLLQVSERDNMNYISIFNYDAARSFEEAKLLRHILPTQANWLELHRLENFDVERCWFPDALLTHVYLATAKAQPLDKRLFVRTLVLRPDSKTESRGDGRARGSRQVRAAHGLQHARAGHRRLSVRAHRDQPHLLPPARARLHLDLVQARERDRDAAAAPPGI